MTELNSLLTVAKAASRAGADVLAQRPHSITPLTAQQLGADTKSSGSDWVTDFDRNAEEAVRRVINAYRPHDEIYGEEYGRTEVEDPSGYRWSIDPLDGTTNFIRGIPQFCTSVAVCSGDQWLAGAVVAPALGQIWYASRGQGAYSALLNNDAASEPVPLTGPVAHRSGRLLATGFGYDAARRTFQSGVLQDLLADFGDIRRIGSAALDLCMVADGTLDAFAEYGLQEYDWAAAALIAEEAGLTVRRPRWATSATTPDWTVAGDIGRDHHQLPTQN